ncbi:MAG: alpha/beta hydrolase [Candidatus Nanopelagicales bacterium]|nr:alpha/beta hydrolase [Candidatus Nanopelagicales bacterium]
MRWMRAVVGVAALGLVLGGAPAWAAPDAQVDQDGPITWLDCPSYLPNDVDCGRLDAPIDWDVRPGGPAEPPLSGADDPRRASIAFAVHRATGERRGTYTFNPGGPGGSGMGVLRTWLTGEPYGPWGALPPEILRHYDVIAWDPRGVGESTPALEGCDGSATYGELPQAGPVNWRAVATAYAESMTEALSDCFAANPDLAPYLGTHYVIRDLEALRAALGVARWTYNGVSYGTTVGMAYAREYPDRVRALVLDGVAPTNQSQLQQASTMAWAWSTALRTFTGRYPAGFSAKVNRVIAALDEGPLDFRGEPYPRFATEFLGLDRQVASLWMQGRYDGQRSTFQALDRAARERGPVPQPVAPRPAQAEPVPFIVSFVLCADRPDRPTVEQVAAIAETTASAGLTAAGLQGIQRGLWCAGLPRIGVPLDASSVPLRLANAALVVNATGDPKTPWLRARVAASTIAGARLISYTGTQHGLYRRVGSTCVDAAITRYLTTLRLPAGDMNCSFSVAPPL